MIEFADLQSGAAQVEARTSSLRITGLRATWVNPVVYLRVETKQGIVGRGEI